MDEKSSTSFKCYRRNSSEECSALLVENVKFDFYITPGDISRSLIHRRTVIKVTHSPVPRLSFKLGVQHRPRYCTVCVVAVDYRSHHSVLAIYFCAFSASNSGHEIQINKGSVHLSQEECVVRPCGSLRHRYQQSTPFASINNRVLW